MYMFIIALYADKFVVEEKKVETKKNGTRVLRRG